MTDYTRAACRAIPDADRDAVFFPGPGRNNAKRAKAICRGCPISLGCLRDTLDLEADLDARSRHGIYGATTPAERAQLVRSHR